MNIFNNAKKIKERGGYIALTTALVLMLLMLGAGTSLGLGSFLGRFDSQNLEFKKTAQFLAKSCGEIALLKFSAGNYSGNETITIGTNQCTIMPITLQPGKWVMRTTATVGGVTSNLRLIVDNYTLSLTSLEDLQNF